MTLQAADAARVLEEPEQRIDGREKVTGRARYAADHAMPGMPWATLTLSPVPHARIR